MNKLSKSEKVFLFFIVSIIAFAYIFYIVILAKQVGVSDTVIGAAGNILGGVLGGLLTLVGVKMGLSNQRKDELVNKLDIAKIIYNTIYAKIQIISRDHTQYFNVNANSPTHFNIYVNCLDELRSVLNDNMPLTVNAGYEIYNIVYTINSYTDRILSYLQGSNQFSQIPAQSRMNLDVLIPLLDEWVLKLNSVINDLTQKLED